MLDAKEYVIEKMADKLLVYKQRISSIEIRLSSFVVKILQPDDSFAPSRVRIPIQLHHVALNLISSLWLL